MTHRKLLGLVAGAYWMSAAKLLACASCGGEVLSLYPWEKWKAYVGFSRTGDMERVDSDGHKAGEYGPQSRNTTTVSLGHNFSSRWSTTLTAPYIVNKRREFQRSGWGDPRASISYMLLSQSTNEEWIPQVQLFGSYRPAQATSIYDYQDPARLDVFGTGVPEARMGADVWNGLSDWRYGVAQTVAVPVGEGHTDIGTVRPGVELTTMISGGYGWTDHAKVIAGIKREYTSEKSVDGAMVRDSDSLGHGVFVTADAKVERGALIRLTWSRAASLFENRNTSRNQTVTMAMIRAF